MCYRSSDLETEYLSHDPSELPRHGTGNDFTAPSPPQVWAVLLSVSSTGAWGSQATMPTTLFSPFFTSHLSVSSLPLASGWAPSTHLSGHHAFTFFPFLMLRTCFTYRHNFSQLLVGFVLLQNPKGRPSVSEVCNIYYICEAAKTKTSLYWKQASGDFWREQFSWTSVPHKIQTRWLNT